MGTPKTSISTHPLGESKNSPNTPSGTWPLDTPGGRFHAEWDHQAPVTREGPLIFFFQFLQAGGRWEEFLRDCPLHYIGNRGSGGRPHHGKGPSQRLERPLALCPHQWRAWVTGSTPGC